MIGSDLENNKLKSFKINKIKNLISKTENLLGNELYTLKEKVKSIKSPWIENTKEAVCRVYYPLSENVIEEVIKEGDNFVDIKIKYYDEREAFDLIKKYLPFVKVMDEGLREKMKRLLEDSMKNL